MRHLGTSMEDLLVVYVTEGLGRWSFHWIVGVYRRGKSHILQDIKPSVLGS